MGSTAVGKARSAGARRGSTPVRVQARPRAQTDGLDLIAHEGEIVGLAGLAGHGQTELLLSIFRAATGSGFSRFPSLILVTDPEALIAGDRQSDGGFLLYAMTENIGMTSTAPFREGR